MKIITSFIFLIFFSLSAMAETYNLSVDIVTLDTGKFKRQAIGYNGATPGPTLRFKEGENVTINVTNNLDVTTSIHWHGLILPYNQDGVPNISYAGIKPGESFTYNFPIVQSGTYWFHSHSGFQEPDGAYGSIVIEAKGREPFKYDRDYVIQLTDAHPHSGDRIMRNLKMMPDYYNRQQETLVGFFKDSKKNGLSETMDDRKAWGSMRMMKTDIEDVQGFIPLINGKTASDNWTGLFKKGEKIRLRFINSSAMTYFDIKIPGLKMTVVAADGNNVQPVRVDELRIAVAETYDVIVKPEEDIAYSIFAASMAKSAFGRATLAPREGMQANIPTMGDKPSLTMADMSMDHGNMDMSMEGMDHSKMKMVDGKMDHSQMKMGNSKIDPFYAVGSGLTPKADNDGKFLSYSDLKTQKILYKDRDATREIEVRLTGNMDRYIWSINGKKYEDADPIKLQYGERVRFKFVNETMMSHPMHLHGMWSILDTGADKWNPIKHTVSVAPGTTLYTETEVDAIGEWAFHCHLSYHADGGMFRKIVVEGIPNQQASLTSNVQ
ncbi:MAG: copper resistance system multicopper oxidase [Candidatus Pelagibacterales bacterium]